ncbi:putative VP1 [Bufavirus-3]|nr:putative VP1 [Bufavirus-3]BAO56903.1 putative VP1 [Bufavirus-3]
MPAIRKARGWVPPGYNYLGPFNQDFSKKPTNPSDKAARKHDLEYNKLIKQGHNPYWNYNHADEDFIKETDQATDWGGKFGNFIFRAKKALAPELAPPTKKKTKTKHTEPEYSHKHIKAGTKRGKPFYLFVNLARKKARMSESNEIDEQPAEQQPLAATAAKAGGGGGGGGSGVGHSTGNYNNRTIFHYHGDEVTIICHATRHIHLNMSPTEEYKIYDTNHGPEFPNTGDQTQQGRNTVNDSYHAKVETPWYLINPNSWGIWFNPADFQQLITTCTHVTIETLTQEIDNIVIKTVSKQGSGAEETTQYNNDLTALLEVALDKSNMLPWVADNMYLNSLGYIPWRPCKLTQFCYHTNFYNTINLLEGTQQNQWSQIKEGIQYDNLQFTPIETSAEIDLLRTGDRWTSGTYHFKCKPTQLFYHWQSTRHIGAPHPTTSPEQEGQKGQIIQDTNGWQWGDRDNPISASTTVKDFHIGYSWPEWRWHYSTGGPSINPGSAFSQTPWGSEVGGTRLTQGASEKAIFDYNHGEAEPGHRDQWWQNNAQQTGQTNWAIKNAHQSELRNATASRETFWTQDYHNTFGPYTAVDDVGIQYPWGAMWGKEPDTTHKPMMSAHAPFTCQNGPPGQLLVKLAPNYTDSLNNEGLQTNRIVTFATFWWTGRCTFKAKLRTPRQFNAYQLPGIPSGTNPKKFVPDAIGRFELPFMPGRAMPNYTY